MIRTLALIVSLAAAPAALAGNSSGTNLMGDGPVDIGSELRPGCGPEALTPPGPVERPPL